MHPTKFKFRGDFAVLDYEQIVTEQLRLMGYTLAQPAEVGMSLVMKATILTAQNKHLENCLAPFLKPKHTEAIKKIKLKDIDSAGDPDGFLEYYYLLSGWETLLVQTAFESKLLKIDIKDMSALEGIQKGED